MRPILARNEEMMKSVFFNSLGFRFSFLVSFSFIETVEWRVMNPRFSIWKEIWSEVYRQHCYLLWVVCVVKKIVELIFTSKFLENWTFFGKGIFVFYKVFVWAELNNSLWDLDKILLQGKEFLLILLGSKMIT